MRLFSGLAVLGHCVNLALSAELRIQISPSLHLPNPSTLPPSTHATLTGSSGELRALIRKDNSIVFSEIPSAGSHLLRIYTRDYVFAPYRVDIQADAAAKSDGTVISAIYETYLGTQWSDHGVGLIPVNSAATTYTLVPKTIAKKTFYEDRPGFSVMVLLKNPMILLGGVALLFAFGLPKLMENMDPEMKAEFEEMQKKGPTASLGKAMAGGGQTSGSAAASGGGGFDLAGYLAGSGGSGGASSNKPSSKASGREAGGNARERKR